MQGTYLWLKRRGRQRQPSPKREAEIAVVSPLEAKASNAMPINPMEPLSQDPRCLMRDQRQSPTFCTCAKCQGFIKGPRLAVEKARNAMVGSTLSPRKRRAWGCNPTACVQTGAKARPVVVFRASARVIPPLFLLRC